MAKEIELITTPATNVRKRVIQGVYPNNANYGRSLASTCTVEHFGQGLLNRVVATFATHTFAFADEAGVVAYAGDEFYRFPTGVIRVVHAWCDVAITLSSAGVDVDAAGDFGVGSVTASNNSTLATTEQNFIPTTALTMVAGTDDLQANSGATEAAPVGSLTTATGLFFNVLADDADHDVTGTACNAILNGTFTLDYIHGGAT